MPQILVRNLESDVVQRLKDRAARHGRSLQGEVKQVLTESVGVSFAQARALSRQWQTRLAGRDLPDTTDLLREDRER